MSTVRLGLRENLGQFSLLVVVNAFVGAMIGMERSILPAIAAMVYPTLLAAIGDVAHPAWRASSVGVYRLWRDLGYAVGALLAGITADAFGLPAAMWLVAALTLASGFIVAVRMRETLQRPTATDLAEPACIEPETLRGGLNVVIVRDMSMARSISRSTRSPSAHPNFPTMHRSHTVCGKGDGRSECAAKQLRASGFSSARPFCGGTQAWMQMAAQGK